MTSRETTAREITRESKAVLRARAIAERDQKLAADAPLSMAAFQPLQQAITDADESPAGMEIAAENARLLVAVETTLQELAARYFDELEADANYFHNLNFGTSLKAIISPERYLVFERVSLTGRDVVQGISRHHGIIRQRRKAGTAEERQAAKEAHAVACQQRDEQVPQLRAEAERLLAAATNLEQAAQLTGAVVEKHVVAIGLLRKLVPPFLEIKIQQERREVYARYAQRQTELEGLLRDSRLAELKWQTTYDSDYSAAVHAAESRWPEMVTYTLEERAMVTHRVPKLNVSAWKSKVAELLAAIPAAEAELADLKRQRAIDLEEIEALRDQYLGLPVER